MLTRAAPRYEAGQPIVVHHDKPWQQGRPVRMQGRVDSFEGDRLGFSGAPK